MKKWKSRWLLSLVVGLLCAAMVSLAFHLGLLEVLEYKSLDHRFRSMPRWQGESSPADISIVVIDQASIEKVYKDIDQRWAWPREFYAKVLGFLKAAGARAVIFDMYFSEPDIDRDVILGADSDAALVAATRYVTNTFHSYVLQRNGLPPEPDEYDAIAAKSAFPGQIQTGATDHLRKFTTGALPSAALTAGATGVGFATVAEERDNICRRIQLIAGFRGTTVMCQSLAAGHVLMNRPPLTLAPGCMRIGPQTVSIDNSASAYLWWYRPQEGERSPFPQHSIYNVLRAAVRLEDGRDPELSFDDFHDRIIYIGSTAPGLFDVWATPLSGAVPGVEVQTTALANLLRNDFVSRVSPHTTHVMVLILCLLVAHTTHMGRRHALSMLIPLILLATTVGGAYLTLSARHLFVDLVPPALAIVGTFGITTITNYLTERHHSKMVRGIFEHYLDRGVVNNLIANPEQVRLGGETRECTVLFTDIANFTNTSEQLGPEQVVHFMNVYLNAMTDIIIEEGGFVDKFIGDEIIAIFGAPNVLPDHAERACRAVLRMRDKVKELQPEFKAAGCQTEIFARTGMCTGDVVIGNMGSETRMNYTAMGNTMNLGSRIQGINKVYGTRIMVSESTARAASESLLFREIDAVLVKGKEQGERVHELIGERKSATVPATTCEAYSEALELFRQRQWEEAGALFRKLAEDGDPPSEVFAKRCDEYDERPPPEEWNGIYVMQTK
jgi:adenylate cyclase